MRLKIPKWIKWLVFLFCSFHLQAILWGLTRGLGMQFSTKIQWIEVSDIWWIFTPLLILYNIVFQPTVSSSMMIVLALFLIISKLGKRTWSDYLTFVSVVFFVYIGFIYNFKLFEPYNNHPAFSWLDDFTSPRSYDMFIFYSYFCGNFLFMLIYIPIWKWFQKKVRASTI